MGDSPSESVRFRRYRRGTGFALDSDRWLAPAPIRSCAGCGTDALSPQAEGSWAVPGLHILLRPPQHDTSRPGRTLLRSQIRRARLKLSGPLDSPDGDVVRSGLGEAFRREICGAGR